MPPSLRHASSRGFTLIELMVGLTLAAVLAVLAVPSFTGLINSNRVTSATNELVSALALARTEAIRRGTRVSICISADAVSVTPSCAAAGNWSQGWIVFVDAVRDGATMVYDAGANADTLLAAQGPLHASLVVNGSNTAAAYVSFAPDGQSRQIDGTPSLANTRLRICSNTTSLTDSQRARDVAIDFVGRVHTTQPASVTTACNL